MKKFQRSALILLALAMVFPVGCTRSAVTGEKEVILISTDKEISLGQQAGPEIEKEFDDKVPNESLQKYVANVGGKLADVSDRPMPYEFSLLASKVPNGFALPGGKIYVTAGLVSRMTNERQLAAVLAHEVIHVADRHGVKGLQRQMGATILVELVGMAAGVGKAQSAQATAELAAGIANLKYNRADESQSDAVGVKYMVRAGYNPWGMVELLELLQSLSNAEPGLFGDMFATHPLTSKRIAEVRDLVQKEYSAFSPTTPDPREQDFIQMRSLLIDTLKD
jgi:predicted Zn-dependent protease